MIGSWQVSARQTSSLALDPGAGLYHTCTDNDYSLYTRLSRDCFYNNLEVKLLYQCCTPPYFKKLGGVFPKYAAAAYAGVESSELFQIFVPCTRFAILYIFVKSKFWQLIRTIFNVLDNRFMIIVSKTFSLK